MFEGLNRYLNAKAVETYLVIIWQVLSIIFLVAGCWLLITQAGKFLNL